MNAVAGAPYPPPLRAWWTVAVFSLISIASVLDRGILNLIVDPVRHDLGISDVQISLLQGLAFGLFYATVGLPLGLVADRLSRRRLIIAGVSIWSVATIYGGLATSFAGMFASRMLVGLGEATLSPAAISMISDMFPANRRGRPISIFLMGQGLASGISIQLTGLILAAAPKGQFNFLFGDDPPAPWRVAFIICGMLGVPAILLMLTIREPRRRGAILGRDSIIGAQSAVGYLAQNRRVFLPLYLGFAIVSMAAYGSGAWLPTLLIRGYGMDAKTIGHWLGLASMCAGALGALSGGYAVDRISRNGRSAGKMAILVIVCLVALPGAFAVLAPSGIGAIMIGSILIASFPILGTAVISATQEMVPANMRGIAVSLMGFSNAVIGLTLGPLLIAFATERVFHDQKLVGYSIAAVSATALATGAGIFYIAYRGLKRSIQSRGGLDNIMALDSLAVAPPAPPRH